MTQQKQDIQEFVERFSFATDLEGKSFLISGATGLIGSSIVKCLLALGIDVNIVIPVRNVEKAVKIYGDEVNKLRVVEIASLEEWSGKVNDYYDFVIHCASPTVGKYMEVYPLETYNLAYEVTNNLLKLTYKTKGKGFVYVSSLEYYGQILTDDIVTEDMVGYLDATSARSSYPMGKRAAEYLCYAYAKEYAVPAKVARLTQTFGAGVSVDDNRVFAQFVRNSIEGRDIVLHTAGESSKPYCYTTDAVSAILYILLKGHNGEAYNVANEDTYISVKEMAEFVKETFNPSINVRVELNDNMGYAPVTKLHLSAKKLMGLGWKPRYGLKDMFERLINDMRNQ